MQLYSCMYHVSTVFVRLCSSFVLCYNANMSKYGGYTPSRKKANDKYLTEKVDSIMVRVPKGQKELIQEAAKKQNKSVNQFCADAIINAAHSVIDT